jgi:hypothetical protein
VKKFPMLRIQLSDRLGRHKNIAPIVGVKMINVKRAESFMVAQGSLQNGFVFLLCRSCET